MGAPEFGTKEACIFAIRCFGLFCMEACIAILVALIDLMRNGPTYRKHRKLPLWEMPLEEKAKQLVTIAIYTNVNMMQIQQAIKSMQSDPTASDAAAFLVGFQKFWPFPMHLALMCLATFQSPNHSMYILALVVAFESGGRLFWTLMGRRHYPMWFIVLSVSLTVFCALEAVRWKNDPIETTEQGDPGHTQ